MFEVGDIVILNRDQSSTYKAGDECTIVAKYPGRIIFYDIQKNNVVGCPVAKKIPQNQLSAKGKK